MLCLCSGLDVLGEISLSNSRQSGFAKAAMECLLDSNLPAKYAMTGSLSSNNIIQDGFYDCGPVRRRILVRQKCFIVISNCTNVRIRLGEISWCIECYLFITKCFFIRLKDLEI